MELLPCDLAPCYLCQLSLTFVEKGRMGNFPINQKIKTIKVFDSFDSFDYLIIYISLLFFLVVTPTMPEINQRIKISQRFWILDSANFPWTNRPTDGPTDRPTDGPTDGPTNGPTDRPTDRPTV